MVRELICSKPTSGCISGVSEHSLAYSIMVHNLMKEEDYWQEMKIHLKMTGNSKLINLVRRALT